jgi:hypothetical protein
MTPSLTYCVKYKNKCFTFVHYKRHYNYGDSLFKIALNIKDIINNGESRFLRLFDKLRIINPDSYEEDEAYNFIDNLKLDNYSYMMAYEYDLLTLMRNGFVFSYSEEDTVKGDIHIEVDFNRRELREIVSWLLVARKIYSFNNINEAINDGKKVY